MEVRQKGFLIQSPADLIRCHALIQVDTEIEDGKETPHYISLVKQWVLVVAGFYRIRFFPVAIFWMLKTYLFFWW